MLVQKISSANGRESDRQYLRIWEETDGEGHDGDISILYFASARERPRYIEVHREFANRQFVDSTHNILGNNIDPGFRRSHRNLVLELQILQSGQHLRITFLSALGWSPASFSAQGIHVTWPQSSLFSHVPSSLSSAFIDPDSCLHRPATLYRDTL